MLQASDWLAQQSAADHRRFLNLLAGSLLVHALLLGLFAFTPAADAPLLPDVLTVNLVSLPASRPVPKVAPAPAPKPLPVPKQVVLPKQAPRAVPKKRVAPSPVRPEPIEYDDALSQLRQELGESEPPPSPVEDVSDEALQATTAPAEPRRGTVDPDLEAWVLATKRHVRSRYITPAEFLNRRLATGVEVALSAGGQLVRKPRVVRSSGDPFFDDNAIRTVRMSDPLPAPPRSGTYTFVFTSEER